jgi:hypothetical protein
MNAGLLLSLSGGGLQLLARPVHPPLKEGSPSVAAGVLIL